VTFNAFCVAVVADVAVVIAAGLSQQQRTRVNGRRGDRFNLLVANRPVTARHGLDFVLFSLFILIVEIIARYSAASGKGNINKLVNCTRYSALGTRY